MTFPQFLENRFLTWQQKEGGRRTVKQFAEWLGFPQSTLSTWWTKDITPKDEEVLRKLAIKLGMEVYDVLGLPRPDPDLIYIQQNWPQLSPAERRALREQAEKYESENAQHEPKRTHKKRESGSAH